MDSKTVSNIAEQHIDGSLKMMVRGTEEEKSSVTKNKLLQMLRSFKATWKIILKENHFLISALGTSELTEKGAQGFRGS